MKKVILTGLVSVALSATLAEAKFFVGLQGTFNMLGASGNIPNYPFAAITEKVGWGSSGFYDQNLHGWGVGLNLGTEHLFSEYFGFRWFVGVNYNRWLNTSGLSLLANGLYTTNDINVEIGADALINFINTGSFQFGVFVGLAARFTFPFLTNVQENLSWETVSFYPILGRAGLTFGLGERSRIDLGVNIPIASFNTFTNSVVHYAPLEFTLGYKILF